MSKYLAVIKDSLREALASRVLWIVLILITILLLFLAPLSFREDLTWQLRDSDVRDWRDMLLTVRDEADANKPSPAHRIWTLLPKEHRADILALKITGEEQNEQNPFELIRVFTRFPKEINKLLQRRDFYDDESFNDVQMASNDLI